MDAYGDLPVFTRTGTRWTNTVGLPFEWQMHPAQCRKHVAQGMKASRLHPWDTREPKLIWRGSNSNCRNPRCKIALAAGGEDAEAARAMEACGRQPFWELRDCTWNSSTWLQMPRGRLVWLSRFIPSTDAKFTLMPGYLNLEPALEEFWRDEGLIADEPMPLLEQARYKYVIAVECDSAPDRAYWQLFTGATVLIPEGPWQVLALHQLLEPFVHYVPLKYDLSDLPEKLEWLQQNDAEAENIMKRGIAFAKKYLNCEGIAHYVDRLLRAYAERLDD